MLLSWDILDQVLKFFSGKRLETNQISGTTMTQEMVWLMLNNFDLKTALDKSLIARVPLLE